MNSGDEQFESGEPQAVGLIQPYLDGELAPADISKVEQQLAADPALQALVQEQLEIRAVLQAMPRETAPSSLRARILLDLDAVDRERSLGASPARARAGLRWWSRARAFARGTAVMIPATAAALALFFLVRGDDPGTSTNLPAAPRVASASGDVTEPPASPPLDDEQANTMSLDKLSADGSVPVHFTGARTPDEVHLVGLEVPEPRQSRARGWTARAVYQAGRDGPRIVDLQQRALGLTPRGTVQMYRGHAFYLDTDRAGDPSVQFVVNGTLHELSFVQNTATTRTNAQARTGVLLELGHELATASVRP